VLFVEGESLLARFEEKAFAEFEKELFNPVDNGGFQVGLGIAGALVEAEEFEDERLLEQVARLGDGLAFLGEAADAVFVAAQGQALVEAGIELAAEFADGPVLGGSFDFVEASLVGVFDGEEENVVGPAQGEGRLRIGASFPVNDWPFGKELNWPVIDWPIRSSFCK
jgi:hypothetical protein